MTTDTLTFGAIIDLVSGRWKSQIIYAGVFLGVFEHLSPDAPRSSAEVATEIGADAGLLYRLLRALASIGLLVEGTDHTFRLQAAATALRQDHPQSLRGLVLLEEGPVHYAIWRHLPEMIRTGVQDGMRHEFGMPLFDYFEQNAAYAGIFQQAMSSYSAAEGHAIRQLLAGRVLDQGVLCDIGGGYGGLLAELMQDRPNASGIVFDLPKVTADEAKRGTRRQDLAGRVSHVGGDMFQALPPADAYFLKHILHDWNDEECVTILRTARQAAKPGARLFICELTVTAPSEPHFAKIFDIHMLCICSGRQRTAEELQALLDIAGWRSISLYPLEGSPMAVMEAVAV